VTLPHADDESASRRAESASPRSWYHAWFSTFGTWLRGDARGFRDRDHRIHSSGDYRNPPPIEEHAGLRRWVIEHLHKDPVRLRAAQRPQVGRVIVQQLRQRGADVLVVAVASDQVHLVLRCGSGEVRQLVGHAKRWSSHAIRAQIPGTVWAKKCGLKLIRSRAQQVATFEYITRHASRGAWVWTFRNHPPEGA
jgi:REP element-mobilizing transposase RayT